MAQNTTKNAWQLARVLHSVFFACLTGKKKALTAAIEVLQAELDSSLKKKSSKIKWKDISPAKKDKKDKSSSDKIEEEIFLG
jgi:hypothetical protein